MKAKISNFTQNFKHPVRIGLVGKIGNGKSAATNSYYSIFNGEFEYVNIVGLIGEHSLTSEPQPVQIPSTNLTLLDFFGWDNPDSYRSDLKCLIQGLAPDNLKEGQTTRGKFMQIFFFPTDEFWCNN